MTFYWTFVQLATYNLSSLVVLVASLYRLCYHTFQITEPLTPEAGACGSISPGFQGSWTAQLTVLSL